MTVFFALDGEDSSQLILIFEPCQFIELFVILVKACDNVKDTKVGALIEFDVHLVVEIGEDEPSTALCEKVKARDLISL